MLNRRLAAAVAGAGTLGTLVFGLGAPASAEREFLETALTGAAERPGPGDPDGSGSALVALFPEEGRICYVIEVQGIAPATAAHIHEAPEDAAGPVVLTLEAPTRGRSRACTSADPELLQEIADEPGDYYVNVHNAEYPGGALRGQLG